MFMESTTPPEPLPDTLQARAEAWQALWDSPNYHDRAACDERTEGLIHDLLDALIESHAQTQAAVQRAEGAEQRLQGAYDDAARAYAREDAAKAALAQERARNKTLPDELQTRMATMLAEPGSGWLSIGRAELRALLDALIEARKETKAMYDDYQELGREWEADTAAADLLKERATNKALVAALTLGVKTQDMFWDRIDGDLDALMAFGATFNAMRAALADTPAPEAAPVAEMPCPACGGSGQVVERSWECGRCKGSGRALKEGQG